MSSHRGLSPLTGGTAVRLAGVLLAGAILTACGGHAPAPSQKWNGMEVALESRPNPPRAGMNEFLVTITDPRGRPDFSLIVSLRTNQNEPWVQAIQDGQMGVYRRAVRIVPATDKMLEIQLQSRDATDVLSFPLQLQP